MSEEKNLRDLLLLAEKDPAFRMKLLSNPEAAASLISQFDGKTSIRDSITLSLRRKSISGESGVLDNFLITLSYQKVLPIIRRLIEQKVLVTSF